MTRRNGNSSQRCRVLDYIRRRGLGRARDMVARGISRKTLTEMAARGEIQRVTRGVYALPGREISQHRALAQLCAQTPRAVVCLLSALRFHELTDQVPWQVWIALGRGVSVPRQKDIEMRIVRFSGPALTYGIDHHRIEGVRVSVTTPAKTVADCFKFRNKIGSDVAVEALRDFRRRRAGSMDDLHAAAVVCRVSNVMAPYLEATA